ncbi:MAG: hypothetical protein RRA92_06460, partial [Gemmatimonadota bacterium]|nr:hypothetical protein [Gemmatimonadota bacterium]
LRDAGAGAAGEGAETHVRAAFPADRAIRWVPRRRGAGEPGRDATGSPEPDWRIGIASGCLAALRAHTERAGAEEPFGFLVGRLYECPDTGIRYTIADQVVEAPGEFAEEDGGARLLKAWSAVGDVLHRHPGVLLGWYHVHRLSGLRPSETDRDVNRRYFGASWQFSVLLTAEGEEPLGGVFRTAPPADEPCPFHEISEGDAAGTPALWWTNYEADRVGVAGPGAEAPRHEVLGRTPPAGRTSGPSPPADPDAAVGFVLPDESSERLFPRLRRRSATLPLVVLAFAVGVVGVAFVRGRGGPGEAPVVVPEAAPAAWVRAARSLELAIRGYGERRGDFEAGRIGCDLLATGYARVDDSFLRLATEIAGLEPTETTPRARFDELAASVDDVNRHFDGSGCQRPR